MARSNKYAPDPLDVLSERTGAKRVCALTQNA
jgi:hypothetical protein